MVCAKCGREGEYVNDTCGVCAGTCKAEDYAPKAKAKNTWGKVRPKDRPYAIYANNQGWTWNVLKAYQTEAKEKTNPYARWFCFVTSPFCPEGEYGDTFVNDIVSNACKMSSEMR